MVLMTSQVRLASIIQDGGPLAVNLIRTLAVSNYDPKKPINNQPVDDLADEITRQLQDTENYPTRFDQSRTRMLLLTIM